MKAILIGEAPGLNTDPHKPLNCDSLNSAGGRLRKIMNIDKKEYALRFDKINLYMHRPERWSILKARLKAEEMLPGMYDREVFLLGKRVAHAFGLMELPFYTRISIGGIILCVVPHPSGLNRWYNDPDNIKISTNFWNEFITNQSCHLDNPYDRIEDTK